MPPANHAQPSTEGPDQTRRGTDTLGTGQTNAPGVVSDQLRSRGRIGAQRLPYPEAGTESQRVVEPPADTPGRNAAHRVAGGSTMADQADRQTALLPADPPGPKHPTGQPASGTNDPTSSKADSAHGQQFAEALALIAALPLSPAEKAEAVRRLLAQDQAAG